MTSFLGVDRDKIRWAGEVAVCASSQGVQRGFCSACGSQLFYQADRWGHETHLYAATMDDPSKFQPMAHFHWSEKVDWLHISDTLPKYALTADGAEPLDV